MVEDLVATMVGEYLSEPKQPDVFCLLRYWSTKQSVWLDLCTVAQYLLSCPLTSMLS